MESEKFFVESVISLLTDNDLNHLQKGKEIIIKICHGILASPKNYQSLSLSSDLLGELMYICGGLQCLFAIGYDEDYNNAEQLIFSSDSLTNLQIACSLFTSHAASHVSPCSMISLQTPENAWREKKFINHFLPYLTDVVPIYENLSTHKAALSKIPFYSLTKTSITKYLNVNEKPSPWCEKHSTEVKDLLLIELLHWFKTEFFSWIDTLRCEDCQIDMEPFTEHFPNVPTVEESRWNASRIESYRCSRCGKKSRFPRYNHPQKLLETRCGRCGEWANCFTLCCRALGFDARLCLDWTDHVWTEVYSVSQKRWLHCDPCENVCDKPYLYEAGWGKKLKYILALSAYDVQDVTWRYSQFKNREDLIRRRTDVPEFWLIQTLSNLRTYLQRDLSSESRASNQTRMFAEWASFLPPLPPGSDSNDSSSSLAAEELRGRTTGSLAWRLARGEAGICGEVATRKREQHVIKLTAFECDTEALHLAYCPNCDKYLRLSKKDESRRQGDATKEDNNVKLKKNNSDYSCASTSNASHCPGTDYTAEASNILSVDEVLLCSRTFSSSLKLNPTQCSEITSWSSLLYAGAERMFRKVEYDWNMVYLARTPESISGDVLRNDTENGKAIKDFQIRWRIELSSECNPSRRFQICEVRGYLSASTFESGSAVWGLIGYYDDNVNESPPVIAKLPNCTSTFVYPDTFVGCKTLEIVCAMNGGTGDLAWQHVQLFRQKYNSSSHFYPFVIKIHFR